MMSGPNPPLPIDIIAIHPSHPLIPLVESLDERCFSVGERTNIAAECERPFTSVWVATHTDPWDYGFVLGYLVAWHVADELHILSIATDPVVRRRGVARRLMAHAVQFAQDHHVRILLLEVRRSNEAALKLYRSMGFVSAGVRKAYYSDGEDAVELALCLDDHPETTSQKQEPFATQHDTVARDHP